MSTKFSGISPVQKPPAVCKKPPPPDPVPFTPFTGQTFQGYAAWHDNFGSDQVTCGGGIEMRPHPAVDEWNGKLDTSPYGLELWMRYNESPCTFDYRIRLLLNGTPVAQRVVNDQYALSLIPFDSNHIEFTQNPEHESIHARIMS